MGHFQIDPDESLQTPLRASDDAGADAAAIAQRAERVLALARQLRSPRALGERPRARRHGRWRHGHRRVAWRRR